MSRRLIPTALLAATLAVPIAGCHKKDHGPPCAKVVDHMLTVTKQMLTGHDEMQIGQRKLMIQHCQRKLSPAERRCLYAAKDLEGFAACNTSKRHAHHVRPGMPGPAHVPASAPHRAAPAASGSGSR